MIPGLLAGNPVFSGGILLLVASYFMGYVKIVVTSLFEYALRRFFIEIELKPSEEGSSFQLCNSGPDASFIFKFHSLSLVDHIRTFLR